MRVKAVLLPAIHIPSQAREPYYYEHCSFGDIEQQRLSIRILNSQELYRLCPNIVEEGRDAWQRSGLEKEVEPHVTSALKMIWSGEPMYKVSQFAEKAGVTVRTLHHYDRLGLLKPSGHTQSGYRLYADRDFARLQQIETLKFIGLPLKRIKEVLDGSDLDIKETLRLQRRLLGDKRRQIELALRAIEEAERSVKPGKTPDWAALKKIIEVMEMQTNKEWMKQYYSESAQARIAEKARNWTPEMQAKVQQDWKDLINDVEAARTRGDDPAGAHARSLAQRWSGLVRGFTGDDPEIQQGVNKLYADQANWPSTFPKPFSDEVWDFVRKAMQAHGISCA